MIDATAFALLDRVSDAHLVATRGGELMFANRAARALFGLTGRHPGGVVADMFEPAEQVRRLCRTAAVAGHSLPARARLAGAATGGDLRLEATLAPVGENRVVLLRVVPSERADAPFQALTLELLQEERRRVTAELNQRVRVRTSELEASNRELEAFTYSISHDLRSPLRAIAGFADILRNDHAERLDDAAHGLIGVIIRNVDKMGILIDGLLEFSRQGRTAMTREPVNMSELAAEVADELVALEEHRSIEVRVGALPVAAADAVLMRQVWSNLVGNAIKFTRDRETARIDIDGREEGGELIYAVTDNGVGFDTKYAGRIFEVFHRLHGEREFEGTGIGLALVQRIVTRHGGRVAVAAELGKGATLTFTLPAP